MHSTSPGIQRHCPLPRTRLRNAIPSIVRGSVCGRRRPVSLIYRKVRCRRAGFPRPGDVCRRQKDPCLPRTTGGARGSDGRSRGFRRPERQRARGGALWYPLDFFRGLIAPRRVISVWISPTIPGPGRRRGARRACLSPVRSPSRGFWPAGRRACPATLFRDPGRTACSRRTALRWRAACRC